MNNTPADQPDKLQNISNKCPACGWKSLFVASGGWLTCGNLDCPNPDYEDALNQHEAQLLSRLLEQMPNDSYAPTGSQHVVEAVNRERQRQRAAIHQELERLTKGKGGK